MIVQILLKAITSVVLHGDIWHIDLHISIMWISSWKIWSTRYCDLLDFLCTFSFKQHRFKTPQSYNNFRYELRCARTSFLGKLRSLLYIIRVMHTELRVDTAWRNEVTSTKFALRHRGAYIRQEQGNKDSHVTRTCVYVCAALTRNQETT